MAVIAPGSKSATEVGRVTIRTAAADGRCRTRLAAMIERVELTPSDMSSGAVLVVDRLGAEVTARAIDHSGPGSDRWRRSPADALDRLLALAARPVDGRIAADAPAVLFTDESELLACLLVDQRTGQLDRRWWWRLVPAAMAARTGRPAPVLGAAPTAMPGALSLLGHWRRLDAIVDRVDDEEATQLLQLLASTFDLPAPGGVEPNPGATAAAARWEGGEKGGEKGDEVDPIVAATTPTVGHPQGRLRPGVRGLWNDVLGPTPLGGLDGPRAVWLATALLLHRRPAAVKDRRHLSAMSRPDLVNGPVGSSPTGPAGEPHDPPLPADDGLSPPAEDPDRAETLGAPVRRPARPADPRRDAGRAGGRPVDDPVTSRSRRSPPANAGPAATMEIGGGDGPGAAIEPVGAEPTDDRRAGSTPAATQASGPVPARTFGEPDGDTSGAAATAEAEVGVATGLAGLFFLINLTKDLDLEASFSPDHLSGIGGWTLLGWLGRGLLADDGGVDPELDRDPIWDVLAELDGDSGPISARDGNQTHAVDPAGPERGYRLPTDLIAAPTGRVHWGSRSGRLLVWIDECFVVADAPLTKEPAEQAREIMAVCGLGGLAHSRRRFDAAPLCTIDPTGGQAPAGVARRVRLLVPWLGFRLSTALGVEPGSAGRSDALRRPGVIRTSRTHVDLIMDLDSASIAERVAGLDHNPGWVPSLRRVVTFVYD